MATSLAFEKRQRRSNKSQITPQEEDELASSEQTELPTPASMNQTPRKPATKISDLLSDSDEPKATPRLVRTPQSDNKRKSEELEDELNSDTVTPNPKKVRMSKRSATKSKFITPMKRNAPQKKSLDQSIDLNLEVDQHGDVQDTVNMSLKDDLDHEGEDHATQRIERQSRQESSPSIIPERRSTRTKKPSRLNEDIPQDVPKSTQKPTPKDKEATAKARANRANSKWESPFVVTDPKSPLIHTNLMKILYNAKAWTSLSLENQRELLTYLPPETNPAMQASELAEMATDGEIPNIPTQRLRRSEKFKSDVRQFQEDLMDGRLDPSWLEAATTASRRREAGEFDDWKTKERELYWEMNLQVEEKDDQEEHFESKELNGESDPLPQ